MNLNNDADRPQVFGCPTDEDFRLMGTPRTANAIPATCAACLAEVWVGPRQQAQRAIIVSEVTYLCLMCAARFQHYTDAEVKVLGRPRE